MHGKARPEPSARFLAESVYQCFAGVGAQVVQNQMDGIGAGVVLSAISKMKSANSGDERVGVTLVKCTLALGSTPQNTLAVPHRLYS